MSEATKRNLLPIHIIIMFALIIGFHFVPPAVGITREGMNLIGNFLQCSMAGHFVTYFGLACWGSSLWRSAAWSLCRNF